MNGTPTASWQRLCTIDRVKLKVTKTSGKSKGTPPTAKLDRFPVLLTLDLVTFNFTLSIAHSLCQLAVGVPRLFQFF